MNTLDNHDVTVPGYPEHCSLKTYAQSTSHLVKLVTRVIREPRETLPVDDFKKFNTLLLTIRKVEVRGVRLVLEENAEDQEFLDEAKRRVEELRGLKGPIVQSALQ